MYSKSPCSLDASYYVWGTFGICFGKICLKILSRWLQLLPSLISKQNNLSNFESPSCTDASSQSSFQYIIWASTPEHCLRGYANNKGSEADQTGWSVVLAENPKDMLCRVDTHTIWKETLLKNSKIAAIAPIILHRNESIIVVLN